MKSVCARACVYELHESNAFLWDQRHKFIRVAAVGARRSHDVICNASVALLGFPESNILAMPVDEKEGKKGGREGEEKKIKRE